jgi:hypothetical protein
MHSQAPLAYRSPGLLFSDAVAECIKRYPVVICMRGMVQLAFVHFSAPDSSIQEEQVALTVNALIGCTWYQ